MLGHLKNPQYMEMVCHQYGLLGFEKLTMAQIGKEYGVTESRISQILKLCIEKLKIYAANSGLDLSDFM